MAKVDRKFDEAAASITRDLSDGEEMIDVVDGVVGMAPGRLLLTNRRIILLGVKLPFGQIAQAVVDLRSIREAQYDSSAMGPNHHTLFISSRQGSIAIRLGNGRGANVEGQRWPGLIMGAVHELEYASSPLPPQHGGNSGLAEQLATMAALRDQGALSPEEFAAAKARLLA